MQLSEFNPFNDFLLKHFCEFLLTLTVRVFLGREKSIKHHHDDDHDDEDHHHHHHHHKSPEKSENKEDKSVKHIVVSHKFVDQGMSIPMDQLAPDLIDSSGLIPSTNSHSSSGWPVSSSGSFDTISPPFSSHSSSGSPAYSSSTPIASVVMGKRPKGSRSSKKTRQSESKEREEKDEEDEDSREDDDYQDDDDQLPPVRQQSYDRDRSKIYSYRDSTVDEPKGYRYASSRPTNGDDLKYSASTNLKLKTNSSGLPSEREPEEAEEELSFLVDQLKSLTVANSTESKPTTEATTSVSTSLASNSSSSPALNKTAAPIGKPATTEDDFFEEVRKLENSLMQKKSEPLKKLKLEPEPPAIKGLSFAEADRPWSGGGKLRRRRRKNRKGKKPRRKHRNMVDSKNRRRRRRKNRRVPLRHSFNDLTASYPILLPAGSRPYLPQDQYADRFTLAQERTKAILGASYMTT